jgi:hypothetical protein
MKTTENLGTAGLAEHETRALKAASSAGGATLATDPTEQNSTERAEHLRS